MGEVGIEQSRIKSRAGGWSRGRVELSYHPARKLCGFLSIDYFDGRSSNFGPELSWAV